MTPEPRRDYRDTLRRKGFHPVTIERTRPEHGHRILDSWARPSRIYGEPIEVRLPMLPEIAEDEAIETRVPWPLVVAGIVTALALIELSHLLLGTPGLAVLWGGRL